MEQQGSAAIVGGTQQSPSLRLCDSASSLFGRWKRCVAWSLWEVRAIALGERLRSLDTAPEDGSKRCSQRVTWADELLPEVAP